MNWMNLPKEYTTNQSKFTILPVSYEKDVTYGQGASKGQDEIIKASKYLEYYDDQFDCEPFEHGIQLLEPISGETPELMIDNVSNITKQHQGKFIIGIGGDHAVTLGLTKNLDENVSIIQFDAHADFRDSWNNSSLNHACVSRQLSKRHSILQIGIRSMDIDEKRLLEQEENVHTILAYNYTPNSIKELLPKLKNKVYITIDVDVFDPSFIRNTGTPEPGGLTWNQIIETLQLIFKEKEVIGTDICEFAPNYNFEAEAYALAKLIYKIMALSSLKSNSSN